MTETQPPPTSASDTAADATIRTVETQELFAGQRELLIVHEGEVYRLRITRRNKLILQK